MQDIRIDNDCSASVRESEPISSELATAINDGLYFYEQVSGHDVTLKLVINYITICFHLLFVSFLFQITCYVPFWLVYHLQELKAKKSHNQRTSGSEMKGGDSKSLNTCQASVNAKTSTSTVGNNGSENHRHPNSRRWQMKGSNKGQSSQKQRLFPGNFRNYSSGRNRLGIVSESPPSNSVGFFFGSTPPDSHGWADICIFFVHYFMLLVPLTECVHISICSPLSLKLSGSPRGILSASSPPVGSLPKSFPPFQHPSHQLLEENGFKQQK